MLGELKTRINHMRPDLPMERVLDHLMRDWGGPNTRYSPMELSIRLSLPPDKLFTTFLMLQGEPLHVLEGQWVFLDGTRELPLADGVLEQTMQTQQFSHPETGAPVPNYMQEIAIIYSAGATLNSVMGLLGAGVRE